MYFNRQSPYLSEVKIDDTSTNYGDIEDFIDEYSNELNHIKKLNIVGHHNWLSLFINTKCSIEEFSFLSDGDKNIIRYKKDQSLLVNIDYLNLHYFKKIINRWHDIERIEIVGWQNDNKELYHEYILSDHFPKEKIKSLKLNDKPSEILVDRCLAKFPGIDKLELEYFIVSNNTLEIKNTAISYNLISNIIHHFPKITAITLDRVTIIGVAFNIPETLDKVISLTLNDISASVSIVNQLLDMTPNI